MPRDHVETLIAPTWGTPVAVHRRPGVRPDVGWAPDHVVTRPVSFSSFSTEKGGISLTTHTPGRVPHAQIRGDVQLGKRMHLYWVFPDHLGLLCGFVALVLFVAPYIAAVVFGRRAHRLTILTSVADALG